MNSKENEYKELFLAEAQSAHEELNKLLTNLEKKPEDKTTIDAIFRITHTLKGNASGMGFNDVADFSHILEDLFGAVREGKLTLSGDHFSTLFKAADTLGALIEGVIEDKKVPHMGIKTKLKVLLNNVEVKKPDTVSKSTADKKKKVNKQGSSKSKTEEDGISDKDDHQDIPDTADNAKEVEETKISFSDLVQVPVKKLDNLLNLVGELIIERDRIMASHQGTQGSNEFARLNRISSDLQYSVMDVRLVQVGFLFNKFHRVVRDVAAVEGKKVNLKLEGTETEIDRNILQIISDSLIHLIRNAVGHGIESAEQRKENGKPEEGTLLLKAYAENDAVLIDIQDDGHGINLSKVKDRAIERGLISASEASEMHNSDMALLIFEPGFSTMDSVTSIAGRGVGMDVVKKALDNVGGTIAVHTEAGKGTTFSLRLPSSMAVKGTLLFEVDHSQYAIPLSYTESVVSLYKSEMHKIGNKVAAVHAGETISIIFLRDLFNESLDSKDYLQKTYSDTHPEQKLDIVIVTHNGRKVGFVVDKLYQQKEIVEKPIAKPIDRSPLFSGVTIMGNGHVCLVLNVASICNLIFNRNFSGKGKLAI